MICEIYEVGFGDMVPSKSFLGYEESLFGKLQVNLSVRDSDKLAKNYEVEVLK